MTVPSAGRAEDPQSRTSGQIPIVQEPSDSQPLPAPEPSSGIAAMRALSNTALMEEAAKKALGAQEVEKTLERFRQLCVSPGDQVAALDETAETLRNAGYKQELMQILREALTRPEVNPHVGALWVRRIVTSKIWDHRYPQNLDALCKDGAVGQQAVIEFLELVGSKRRASLVLQAVGRHAKWLRAHPRGWGVAARALVQARCYHRAAGWMSGWRDRPALDLPLLHSLALALRANGRVKQADEVVRLALASPGAVEQFPVFKLWHALDEAFAGNTTEASLNFKQINPVGWDDDSLALYYLVRGVIRVQKADKPNRKDAFRVARQRIAELFRKARIYKRDVFLRHEYRLCLMRMAKDSGDWPQGVLAVWRSAESWWFVLPLLAIPGLQLFLPCYLYRICSWRRGLNK